MSAHEAALLALGAGVGGSLTAWLLLLVALLNHQPASSKRPETPEGAGRGR